MKIAIGKTSNGAVVALDFEKMIGLLIQANSGGGKSYLLRKLMEGAFGHVQVITIDPEGEFATLREKYGYVLVGKGGETPAHYSTAAVLAHKLLQLRASAICDLYEMPAKERHLWVKEFLSALIDAPKELWHRVLLILDEAHLFCPEKGAGESEASEAVVDVATRGRKRGFILAAATQRLGKLKKDAAAELQNVLIGGTFLDIDVDRAAETLGIAKGSERAEFKAHIKTVRPGIFVALGRAISKERIELLVDEVQTSHPKPGTAKHAGTPPAPETVRELLPKLADLPQVAEEKARTIADFKKQIRDLRTELASAKRGAGAEVKGLTRAAQEDLKKQVEQGIANALALRDQQWMKSIEGHRRRWEAAFTNHIRQMDGVLHGIKFEPPAQVKKITADIQIQKAPPANPEAVKEGGPLPAASGFGASEAAALAATNGELSKSQLRILAALAQFEAIGRLQVKREWVAALAGASHSSSSFGNNLGALRSAGYIAYPSGGEVTLTQLGRGSAPAIEPPVSAEEMLQRCKEIASSSQARILDALFKNYPKAIGKEHLAELAKASATSSSYGNNLGALRSAGMIEYPSPGTAKLSSWVILEE